MYLIFDTETTGFPKNNQAPFSDLDNWPRIVQLAWQIHDKNGKLIENKSYIIYPDGFDIPYNATQIHGISTKKAKEEGKSLKKVFEKFNQYVESSLVVIGHNLQFDLNISGSEFFRIGMETELFAKKHIDTQMIGTSVCKLPGGRGGGFKYPKLSELYFFLFEEYFDEAHNATADVNATARCFFELVRNQHISFHDALMGEKEKQNFLKNFSSIVPVFDVLIHKQVGKLKIPKKNNSKVQHFSSEPLIKNTKHYFPFHNHTVFSILQSTTKISDLVKFAYEQKFPAIGICDYGNLMGAFIFINEVKKINHKIIKQNQKNNSKENQNLIIPIIGCQVYLSEDYQNKKFTKNNPDRRYTQVLLAKNQFGYQNLCKISTIGFTKGMYMDFPRIGKDIIQQYKTNLIATTGNLDSKIPYLILNQGISYAEEEFLWWKNVFNEDFYVQIQNHNIPKEDHVNEVLLKFAKKHRVKILAQNSTNYVKKEEHETQYIALCIKFNVLKTNQVRNRFNNYLKMPSNEFYLKNQEEITNLFQHIPEGIENYKEFLSKFSFYDLERSVLLPKFDIPKSFKNPLDEQDGGKRGENSYLRHLTYEGAKTRYENITPIIKERLEFELITIEKTGYPGYFLIVQDLTNEARKMGVSVGPGRGSSAGSVVAYSTGITNVDPIAYDLLFERFLNPDRVSLPDIDIDFDDRGRDKVINYVVEKYGHYQVAQIITYGKLAGRSALRDVSRVLNFPLSEAGKLAKKLPATLSLNKIKLLNKEELSRLVRPEELQEVLLLKKFIEQDDLKAQVIKEAIKLEGCIRNTGVHACGVIITSEDITNLIPITVSRDAELLVSQFDNSVVESTGLLKMDFLGLKNLTIIQDTIELIEKRHKIKINPDEIPLTDKKTFELFQCGETIGIFQFESIGMQKHLKALKPDKFDDLIAMNALYRPGPIKYIPNFINRKHGIEPITYDLTEMKEYLESTYGITVYQEQVMLLSQKLSNFSKGDADVLRKAMGKKQRFTLDKMKGQFIENGIKNGHPGKILDKIWADWEAFAEYAFNKSHSTCYSLVAFHTAYLKAHYPSEYMAALLSNNLNQITTTSIFMEEAQRMGIEVLGPNLNESEYRFIADKKGNIRFGLGAIKGVGIGAIKSIIKERKENGKFKNLFDFLERIDSMATNKKVLDSFVLAGALDELDSYHRAQYFQKEVSGISTIEKLIRYSNQYKEIKKSEKSSLFDGSSEGFEIKRPSIPNCNKWNEFQKLQQEKETIGIYISAHPMDEYKYEITFLNPVNLIDLQTRKNQYLGKKITVVGITTKVIEWKSTEGKKQSGIIHLEDKSSTMAFKIFDDEYIKFKNLYFQENQFLELELILKESRDKQSIYTNILSISFLSEVLKKKVKKITILLEIEKLNEELVQQLIQLFRENPGEQSLILVLKDNDLKLDLNVPRKNKIQISRQLLEFIKEKELKFALS